MPGRSNPAVREYERKIRNLLVYSSQEARELAIRLLETARHDRNVSAGQIRHLESLFGPEMRKDWFRRERRLSGEPAINPA